MTSPKGKSKTGVGYIFSYENNYYLRSASSLLLGNPKNVNIEVDGVEIKAVSESYVVDNDLDDIIVQLENGVSPFFLEQSAIGYYDKLLDRIVIPKYKAQNCIEFREKAFFSRKGQFFLPGKAKYFDSKSVWNGQISNFVKDQEIEQLEKSANRLNFIPVYDLNPKMSGLPLIEETKFCKFINGFSKDCEVKGYSILGHTVVTNGIFEKIKYVNITQGDLMGVFLRGGRGSVSHTEFKEFGDNAYRFRTENENFEETLTAEYVYEVLEKEKSVLYRSSGKIWSAGGGEVADGSFSECRESRSFSECISRGAWAQNREVKPGMIYKGVHIVAFRAVVFGQIVYLKADWENMIFYEDLKARASADQMGNFTSIPFTMNNVQRLAYSKIEEEGGIKKFGYCKIKMKPESVEVEISDLKTDAFITFNQNIRLTEDNFPLIHIFDYGGSARWTVDVSGIYSTSSSDFKQTNATNNILNKNFMYLSRKMYIQYKFTSEVFQIGWTTLNCQIVD